MFRKTAFLVVLLVLGNLMAEAQDWKRHVRNFLTNDLTGIEIDAPEGLRLLSEPSPEAPALETLPGPMVLKAVGYLETGASRYYLTAEARDLLWDDKTPYWVAVPGTGREAFIAGTTPATMVKRETRDFFKTGPETAEVYEETVNLAPATAWGPGYRRAEIDFRLPAKVSSFRVLDGDAWELDLTVYPAFESNTDRIPGPPPENYGEPYQALITRPVQREVKVTGTGKGEALRSLFVEGSVWAAAFSEGRVQELRIGWHDLEPPHEVSRLSAPHFRRGERMAFRFRLNRLLAEPAQIEVVPDRIVGADWTKYDLIAEIGGEPGEYSDPEMEAYLHQLWNVAVGPDLLVKVVAPLTEGRGAAGSLELESLGLGPSFEEELKALTGMAKATAPPLAAPEDAAWLPVVDHELGTIPEAQRGAETSEEF